MAGSQFWERYQAGEHVPVWRELIRLGDKVREEPLRSDAIRVCEEIVRRACVNLRILHTRLLDLGYGFAEPDAALVDAGPEAVAEIEEVERELGALPLIVRVWYGTFASVNFCQAEEQLAYHQGIRPPSRPDIYGLGSHPALVFESLERCREWARLISAEEEEVASEMEEETTEGMSDSLEPGRFFPLGGCATTCESKGLSLPCYGVDAILYNDGGHDTYFVDELRSAFRWGGFPFWQRRLNNPDFFSPMEYRPNFEKLLPILKEGLWEL